MKTNKRSVEKKRQKRLEYEDESQNRNSGKKTRLNKVIML